MGSQAAEGASKAGENMPSSVSGYQAPSSGFTLDAAGTGTPTQTASGMGPTVENTADLKSGAANPYNDAASDTLRYGTDSPSTMQQFGSTLERFQKGSGQGLGTTIQKFGNNPETYGAAYGLVSKMAGSGKPGGAVPITTNISTVQPENPYLKKRGRY